MSEETQHSALYSYHREILFLWSLEDIWGYMHLNIHQIDYSRAIGTELDSLYPRMG